MPLRLKTTPDSEVDYIDTPVVTTTSPPRGAPSALPFDEAAGPSVWYRSQRQPLLLQCPSWLETCPEAPPLRHYFPPGKWWTPPPAGSEGAAHHRGPRAHSLLHRQANLPAPSSVLRQRPKEPILLRSHGSLNFPKIFGSLQARWRCALRLSRSFWGRAWVAGVGRALAHRRVAPCLDKVRA